MMIAACTLILAVLLAFADTLAERLIAIAVSWLGFGTFFHHLALDVQAAD